MERDGYRETLAYLAEKANGKVWLTQTDAGRLLGIDRKTAIRRFNISCEGISLTELAKRITAKDAQSRNAQFR